MRFDERSLGFPVVGKRVTRGSDFLVWRACGTGVVPRAIRDSPSGNGGGRGDSTRELARFLPMVLRRASRGDALRVHAAPLCSLPALRSPRCCALLPRSAAGPWCWPRCCAAPLRWPLVGVQLGRALQLGLRLPAPAAGPHTGEAAPSPGWDPSCFLVRRRWQGADKERAPRGAAALSGAARCWRACYSSASSDACALSR